MPANRSCLLLRSTLCGCSGRINSAWQHRSLTRCVSAGKGGCRSKLQAHICRSWDTVNDESARGQRTCCQALLDLFQVLLQALPLPIQLCVFLLQVLNPAVSATVWATATTWTASQRPKTHGGQIGKGPPQRCLPNSKGRTAIGWKLASIVCKTPPCLSRSAKSWHCTSPLGDGSSVLCACQVGAGMRAGVKQKRGQNLVVGPWLWLPAAAKVRLTSCWLHQACFAFQKRAPHTWGQSWLLEEQAQSCHWQQQPWCRALAALLWPACSPCSRFHILSIIVHPCLTQPKLAG